MSKSRTTTTARRRNGEGSIDRHHVTDPCPAPVDGVRPEHECTRPFRGRVNVRTATGKTKRVTLYGPTERAVLVKLRAAVAAEAAHGIVDTHWTVARWLDPDAPDGFFAIATTGANAIKPSTARNYRYKVARYVLPAIGSAKLDRLTVDHLRTMYQGMYDAGVSESTARVVHGIMGRSLRIAQAEGHVTRNVAHMMVNPPRQVRRTDLKSLTADDARKVLATAGDDPRWWLALLAGLRQGEVLGLRWCDVELSDEPGGSLVRVRHTLFRDKGEFVLLTPKTRRGERDVPLLPEVAARLKAHRARAVEAGTYAPDMPVFIRDRSHGWDTDWMDAKTDATRWRRLLRDSGVEYVRLHDARRTCAALLEDAGIPYRVAAAILGHDPASGMTAHYQSNNAAALSRAVQSLSGSLGALPALTTSPDGAEVASETK